MKVVPEKVVDTDIIKENYRGHDIVVEYLDNIYSGWLSKADKKIDRLCTDRLDDTIQALRRSVDGIIEKKIDERKNAPPSLAELSNAFVSISKQLTDKQRDILLIHSRVYGREIAINELRRQIGFSSTTDTLLAYADIAHRLCDELALIPPSAAIGDPAIGMLLESDPGQLVNDFAVLVLREDIAKALSLVCW